MRPSISWSGGSTQGALEVGDGLETPAALIIGEDAAVQQGGCKARIERALKLRGGRFDPAGSKTIAAQVVMLPRPCAASAWAR
jgi:hypothetical protein